MAETPDFKKLMEMAQQMQKNMKTAHEDLSRQEHTGEAGAGMVKVTMTGRHGVKPGGVTITDSAFKEGKEVLQDLIAAAINDAVRKVEKASEEKMMKLTKDLGLPMDKRFPSDDE